MVATKLFMQVGIFPGSNIQVTHTNANEPRSESSIVVDPTNPSRLLGASKHFTDPANYVFSLGAVFSEDGGATWTDHAAFAKPANHDIYTDPSAAFDTKGDWFVMGDPGFFTANHTQLFQTLSCSGQPSAHDIRTTHMLANKSTDKGATWNPTPVVAPRCTNDDKGWIVCDNSTARVGVGKFSKPKSPHHGRLYAIWGAGTQFRFGRSDDHGATWTGILGELSGGDVTDALNPAYAPDISISSNGWLHIFWHLPNSATIQYLRSKNGGDTFEGQSVSNGKPVPFVVVSGLTDLDSGITTKANPWTTFEGTTFRVLTIVSAACFGDGGLIVGWADARETTGGTHHSRIYYRVSYDNGDTWEGPTSGSPLLPQLGGDSHQFHPQFAATGSGVVGCAMYSYSKTTRNNHPGVDVLMACSFDHAATYDFAVVTDHPWDPSLHAPVADGVPPATFIGDYFGCDAGATDFHLLWTDTRTGTQDLFYCAVGTERFNPPHYPGIYGTLVGGVAVDGGGYIIVNGHLIKIPPWDPMLQIMIALEAIQVISRMNLGNTVAAREAVYDLVIQVAQLAKTQLKGGSIGGTTAKE